MKPSTKVLLIFLSLIFFERFVRFQTDGFRTEKTYMDFPSEKRWEIQTPPLKDSLLMQTFDYLGSGAQFYAFLGEDKKTVLKLFKHYHLGPPSKILRKIPLFSSWRKNILRKRKERVDSLYSSALIAYKDLRQETGVLCVKLVETQNVYPTITLYDKIGVMHTLDLNKAPFVLQKKADKLPEGPLIQDAISQVINARLKKGIHNSDPPIERNLGILDGKVVEIDIGSFTK